MDRRVIKEHVPVFYENLRLLKALLKTFAVKLFGRSYAQSMEDKVLLDLVGKTSIRNSFVEFGFHPGEFNCMVFALRKWKGLLIDGDERNVETFRRLARFLGLQGNIDAKKQFLTRENCFEIIGNSFGVGEIGILSIDIDGNDYWIAEKLISVRPDVVCIEYNPSFGLRSITVPYDPEFDRHEKHPSGWYHGASLMALAKLMQRNDYRLVGVSMSGLNAFFLKAELVNGRIEVLEVETSYRQGLGRNRRSGMTANGQWERIKSLDYVEV